LITQKSIQEIIETAKIEEVVEDFVTLKRAGVNMKGLCPFHNEKTPSFTVSPNKNIYKCFGCGKAGDSVRFIMDHEKFSFPEALRWLASKYHIELEETKLSDEAEAEKLITDSYYIVNQFAADFYKKELFDTVSGQDIGLSYLKERGLLESTIKKFQIGFAPIAQDKLLQKAKADQYQIEHLETLGLIKNNRDFFRNRIMFPILNLSGKVIGFGGRTLSSEKKIPKYLNSVESEIYEKRKTLYGLYWAKQAIRKEDHCILVEGYTDVITLQQAKIEHVVAASGTSLTKEQILLIKRYTANIKIIFDGDAAGLKAALRGLDLILEQDMNVSLVMLPEKEDPDSFMKKIGQQRFLQYLEEYSKDFIFFKTELLMKEIGNDPIKKTEAIKDIVKSISFIPDALKRSLYIKECSRLLDIAEDTLTGESNNFVRNNRKSEIQKERRTSFREEQQWINKPKVHLQEKNENIHPDYAIELDLAGLLVKYGSALLPDGISVAQFIFDSLQDVYEKIEDPFVLKILELAKGKLSEGEAPKDDFFLQHSDPDVQKFAIDTISKPYQYANWAGKGMELQSQKDPEHNYERESKQIVLRLKSRKLREVLKDLNVRISECPPEDQEKLRVLLLSYQKVNKVLIQIDQEFGMVIYK
jgi:DNA primase